MDISKYSIRQMEDLSSQIRERILEVVSTNGGHLSSTLGAVELIVAMHHVFDPKNDPMIYDVSHQAYAHKLLTDRWNAFSTLRQFDGVSGFIKPSESEFDYFLAGHSSTSLSVAVGAAKAIALKGEKRLPVALIGDGAMSAGMVYEALNELGDRKYPVVIILNDNEMSIAQPIGAISKYLSQAIAGNIYQSLKRRIEKLLDHMPDGAHYMAKRFEESLMLITPGIIFEELGLEYIGPVDGHNLKELVETFKQAKNLEKPVIVHAQTLKGKGYDKAEGYLEHWHGVGPFDIESGKLVKKGGPKSTTAVFSEALLELADQDDKVVGMTAAMPSGTGLSKLLEKYPERFWDVAIAEQHAVTSAAALAKEGFRPFVAIYSTFLQRGFDQIIHDVSLMNLPVAFAIDRAGIVGEDGETHQGVFDISYLRLIPNMTLLAPRDDTALRHAVAFARMHQGPCAFRYPRGAFQVAGEYPDTPFEWGKSEMLQEKDSEILFIGYGNGVNRAMQTVTLMDTDVSVLDLRFVKPLDEEKLCELAQRYKRWFVFSDGVKMGGVASAMAEMLMEKGIGDVRLVSLEFEDTHIPHGKTGDVEEMLQIRPEDLAEKICKFL